VPDDVESPPSFVTGSFEPGLASDVAGSGFPSGPGSPAAFALAAVALDRRSFLAQPDPLKWTAGAAIALRIIPPQTGHAPGPEALTPWTTSMRWPHVVQT